MQICRRTRSVGFSNDAVDDGPHFFTATLDAENQSAGVYSVAPTVNKPILWELWEDNAEGDMGARS